MAPWAVAAAAHAAEAAGKGTDALLVALIVALGTGLPALAYTIWRGRRVGPKEEDELVARAAQQVVGAMQATLEAATRERQEMVAQIAELRAEIHQRGVTIIALERQTRQCEALIEELRGRIAALGG